MNEIRTKFESVLRLEDIKIIESNFKRSEEDVDGLSLGLNVDKDIEKLDDEKFKISLMVSVGDHDNKLNVYVRCIGIFQINEENYQQSLIERNAIAIIFPYVRSYISTITTQPGMSPIVLPPINIIALLNSKN